MNGENGAAAPIPIKPKRKGKNMIQDSILTKEEKKEFCQRYLKYRNAGQTVKEAFRMAEVELNAEGKRVPSFGCVRNWIAKGVPDCPEIDMGKVRGIPRAADAAEDKPNKPDMTDKLDAAEDAELLKLLIKAYRLRSEKTIDDLVDHLLPELFEEA